MPRTSQPADGPSDSAEGNDTPAPRKPHEGLLMLAIMAVIAGAGAGLIGAVFRISLEHANHLRGLMIAAGNATGVDAFPVVVGVCAFGAWLGAYLVRRISPEASGSGIPHVETVLKGEAAPARLHLLPVKFIGGLSAIGAGLALGREGPTIQMGASVANAVARLFRARWNDTRELIAGGAGAGLATAFNAPMAGSVFVMEELVGRFEMRIAIVALGASAAAISVARMILGDAPDFHLPQLPHRGAELAPLCVGIGIFVGLLSCVYNWLTVTLLRMAQGMRLKVEWRAAAIGASVGALGWFLPGLIGGGDPITQATLLGASTLATLPIIFILRLVLSSASYAAGTPGGLFAPMLVLGAQAGLFAEMVLRLWVPEIALSPEAPGALALVGMAAFLAGAVRAPVTGIVLVTEMTDSSVMLLPMVAACFGAMLVTTLLRVAPIYDTLGEMAAKDNRKKAAGAFLSAPPR